MRNPKYFLFIVLSQNIFLTAPSAQECSPTCMEQVKMQSLPAATSISSSGKFQVYGKGRVIVLKDTSPLNERLIVGDKTQLSEISATAIDEKNQEVFIYDRVKKSVFSYQITPNGGNLVPMRTLKVSDVVAMCIDTDKNFLVIAQANSLQIYRRTANADSRKKENAVSALDTIDLSIHHLQKVEGISCDSSNTTAVITDSGKKYRIHLQNKTLTAI